MCSLVFCTQLHAAHHLLVPPAPTDSLWALQGLAESCADEAAGRAIMRQDLLATLHHTVQHHQDTTAQQVATHQALLHRQVRPYLIMHC